MTTTVYTLALVINPYAGIGGAVALKVDPVHQSNGRRFAVVRFKLRFAVFTVDDAANQQDGNAD